MNKPLTHLIDENVIPRSDNSDYSEFGFGNTDVYCAKSRAAVLHQVAFLCSKLIALLESRFTQDDTELQAGLVFLHDYLNLIEQHLISLEPSNAVESLSTLSVQTTTDMSAETALERLTQQLKLSLIELQLLVLAGMAEEHEGFANLFSQLHPSRLPYPTPALLAQLVCKHIEDRQALAYCLIESILIKTQLVKLRGETPTFSRSIHMESGVWYALNSANSLFSLHQPEKIHCCFEGLDKWLNETSATHAKHCLVNKMDALILIKSSEVYVGLNRALALLQTTQNKPLILRVTDKHSDKDFNDFACQCLMSGSIPVLLCAELHPLNLALLPQLCPTVIICSVTNVHLVANTKIQIELTIQRPAHTEAISIWQKLLPEYADNAAQLASWFPLDPYHAQQRVTTWRSLQVEKHSPGNSDLASVCKLFKHYSGASLPQGIKRITPQLGWSDLVLPDDKIQQLKEATTRLKLQHKVLDEWRFLHNRRGAKGVRLLFSGVPGTGKTLSAEVLANELQVDLLIVDLAAVVSKWVGETEKNLASVFSYAEQSQAVLLFDEADAIFGRRTEVNDSHDRYANLETAYLLTRLEAYDGLAILATNFRNNIDVAFIRRLDFIIDFREPSIPDREHLWRCHVPNTAPLNQDVNFTQLATLFPLVGGEIRNAAVAAAYYAAQQQQDIQQAHFIMAIRKEFEKTGKAFREVNLT